MARFIVLTSRRARVLASSVCLAVGLTTAGCGGVAPYEREHHAKRTMDLQREGKPNEFRAHVYDAREGATGSTGSSGGGCGCN